MTKKTKRMTTESHLKELKNRIIVVFVTVVVVFLVLYFNIEPIINFILQMGVNAGYDFVYVSPQEILIQQLRVAIILSLILNIPIIIYELAAFNLPALNVKHAWFKVFLITVFGFFMFFLGAFFAYKLLLPFVYETLYGIGSDVGAQAMVTVENHITFFLTLIICMGLIFEMPLITILLAIFGILRASMLKKAIKPAIVIILIISALVTPPDVVSQLMVAGPMIVLYLVSMLLCKIFERKKQIS